MKDFKQFEAVKKEYNVRTTIRNSRVAKKISNHLGYEFKGYIGSGMYGDAYKISSEGRLYVLKLTKDRDEAKLAEKLRHKNTKHLINYFDVRLLKTELIKDFEVYSIIMEYVEPIMGNLPDTNIEVIDDICDWMTENDLNLDSYSEVKEHLKEKGYSIDSTVYEYIVQLDELSKEIKKFHLNTNVDLHSGNLGIRDKDLVFYDISTFDYSWLQLKPLKF